MKVLQRDIGSISFVANQTRTLELPRNYAYRQLELHFDCNITVTETTAGSVKDSAPAQYIQNIQIRANGRDVIKNIDMATLHRLNQFRRGTRPPVSAPSTTGAVSTTDYSITAIIDFEMWRAVKPIDSLLNSAQLATLDLIVTFGASDCIFGGAYGGTVTVHSGTLYVSGVESVGVPADTPFIVNKEFSIEKTITASSNNLQINLPVSNLYRSFLLKTVSDDVCVNTIIDNIKLQSGTEVFFNKRGADVRDSNKLEVSIESMPNGFYLIDFVKDGRLTESLDTAQLSSLEFILDVNSVGTTDVITIYPVELIQPPVTNG